MTIVPKQLGFYPFYDPYRGSDTLNYPHKIGVSVGLGAFYLLVGLGLATANVTVSHLLGIPADFYATVFSLVIIYLGVFLSGFAAGMGLHGIISIIVLYLRFAPNLRHSLNPNDPDGSGGIKKLGDALWFFGMLIGAVAITRRIWRIS